MWKCFLIVLATLLFTGNKLSGQAGSFDPEIRTFYLYQDTLAGNRLLSQRYTVNGPEYLRLISYRDFLDCLLHQSKANCDGYFRRSVKWIQTLERSRLPNGFIPASIAEIHLYRAVLASQFSDYRSSATELIASYKVVAKSGPDLTAPDRNKLSGILGILFQQVPDQYSRYLRLLGIRPSGLSGFNGLERYYGAAKTGSVERLEGYLLMVTALKEFGPVPAAAWNFVKAEGKPEPGNPLVRYQSGMAAFKAGDCGSAMVMLDFGSSVDGLVGFPYVNYQLGRMKLYQNDISAAKDLEQFLNNPGGDNYRHVATLLAGWHYLLQGNRDRAKSLFLSMANLPAPLTVYDKQAFGEAGSGALPEPELLKARLLFDGGNYETCLKECGKLLQSGRYHGEEEGELLYRRARCEQRMGNIPSAIGSYLRVLELSGQIKSYILPNSALQLGNLYKKSGQVSLARKYYEVCLELNKYGYREGISRQAQVALKELGR